MSAKNAEAVEQEVVEVPGVPAPLDRAEVDVQISTARRFPRSLKAFKDQAIQMATMDQETAESCFYVLPRSEKSIEGPGVRLAEIVASAWGNMRYGSRQIGDDGKFITAQGMAFDLEKNVAVTLEVRRRITDKYGKRYNDDMVGVTGNAAGSIALRNAIFRVIPKAYVNAIYQAAKKVAIGDVKSLSTRRDQILERFAKMGVQKDKILAALQREFQDRQFNGVEDIDLAAIEKLIGIGTAIKDGDMSVDDAFPPLRSVQETPEPKNKTEELAGKLKSQSREPGE